MKGYAVLAAVALAGLSFASIARAGIIVTGGTFGLLTEAHINVPLDPNNDPIPTMRITNTLSEILWVMVTGAPTGTQGALYFSADLWATHFNGSFFGEYIDSWSSITGAINIATPAWLPQGSTPISCYGTGSPCIASFVFGIPTELTFDSTSHVSYVYGGLQNPGGPIFAGYSVVASASLGPPTAVYSYSQNGLLSDATIAFASVPEPATLWLARMAQSLC